MRDHLLNDKLSLHVKIKNAEDLLSNYTYNEDNINPDLSEYLIEKAEHIFPLPTKENFIINIEVCNFYIGNRLFKCGSKSGDGCKK